MNTLVSSLIRTYVPILVGAFIAWLITLGIELDADVQAALVVALTGVLQAAYYTAARLLERKFPAMSILLGSGSQPVAYTTGSPAVHDAEH